MSTLSRVMGFAVIKGGRDLPAGYSDSDPFGFDKGDGDKVIGPIFKYSIDDVENTFNKPYCISSQTQISANKNLRLYVEVSDNSAIKEQDFVTNADWKAVLKIIEWVINNQNNIVNVPPVDSNNYTNYADERLNAELINSEVNPERNLNYVAKSFSFVPSTTASRENRIGQFTFQGLVNGSTIFFQLYLDPDDFCSTVTTDLQKSTYVWWFNEITHDGKIDNQELDEAVVEQLHYAFSEKKYKRKDVFSTKWFKRLDPNDPEKGYATEAVVKWFWVFSNFRPDVDSEFPVESRMEAVRLALIEAYGEVGPDGSKIVTEDLIAQYPELFTRNEILLIPFMQNNSMTIAGGELVQGMHPISVLKLINTAKRYGYSLQTETTVTSGRSKSELFYVGGETPNEGYSNIFRFPILAIEKTSKNLFPISSRFPHYVPKYFDQNWPSTNAADQFQFILTRIFGLLENKYTDEQIESIHSTVSFIITRDDANRVRSVSFTFNNARWIVDNTLDDDNIR